jgi:hypothetical protein
MTGRAGLRSICCPRRQLQQNRAMTLSQLQSAVAAAAPAVTAALRRLAFAGQVIHDLPHGVYRFRQVMPVPLGDAQLGPENPELSGARHLMLTRNARVESAERVGSGIIVTGNVDSTPVEVFVDFDGRIRRGKCVCGHFRKYGIRNGPCRHMIALRYLSSEARPAMAAAGNGSPSRN